MRVLIVDDEPTVLDFFSQAARAKGVEEIETASSGEEALGKVIAQTYDLITLDIRMPGASGLDILSPIRNMCPHALIAVISGHIPDDFTQEMAGCADLLMHKPVNLINFNKLVDGA
ncbi:MAG: response regulator, partial [Candidatus Latescibacteria bacterium]|nr:response regulator [Candidatus Latescibacterota bacterium]